MSNHDFPLEGEGVYADLQVGERKLRLFSVMNSAADGWVASIFDLEAQAWVAQDVPVWSLKEGKQKCEQFARSVAGPDIELAWQKTIHES